MGTWQNDRPDQAPRAHRYITDDHFWPSINLDLLRTHLDLDSSISDSRLEVATLSAMIKVNRTLGVSRKALRRQGYRSLHEVPGELLETLTDLPPDYQTLVETATALELIQHLSVVESGHGRQRPVPGLKPAVLAAPAPGRRHVRS